MSAWGSWNQFIVPHIITVIIVAIFTAIILTIQTYILLFQSGAVNFIGPVIAVTIIKETGPVITGLLCASTVGDSINRTIYHLRTTDQLDALIMLNRNPYTTIITPIIITGILGTVLLIIYGTATSVMASIATCSILGVPLGYVFTDIPLYINNYDIIFTLIKSTIFGATITSISVYKGLSTVTFTPSAGITSIAIVIIDAACAYGWWSLW